MSRENEEHREVVTYYHCLLCGAYFPANERFNETVYCERCGKLFYSPIVQAKEVL